MKLPLQRADDPRRFADHSLQSASRCSTDITFTALGARFAWEDILGRVLCEKKWKRCNSAKLDAKMELKEANRTHGNKSEATVLISELVNYVLISEPRSMWYVMWWFAAILDLRKPGVSPLSLLWSNIICQTSAQISSLRLGFARKTFCINPIWEKRTHRFLFFLQQKNYWFG